MTSHNTLCVVCARGGSKGVPGKNLRTLSGKPVIHWAIEKALKLAGTQRVVVSTDSEDIASCAVAAGAEVPFLRPVKLAESNTGKFQVWQHALISCEEIYNTSFDLFVDIDCTNPLITDDDISGAIDYYKLLASKQSKPDAVFMISKARRNPYFNLVEPRPDGTLGMCKSLGDLPILARQLAPVVYEHVAGAYILNPDYLKKAHHLLDGRTYGYQIPNERAFDIDSELDFSIIEFLLNLQLHP